MAEQIVEMCPNCGNEVAVWWDMQKDGYQIFCPYCGKPTMLCSMCDRSPCDWAEEKGCKHSAGKDNNVPTNDGWIPVERRLPESTDYILLSFSNFSLPTVGRYEEDSEGGAFYLGDDEETCVSQGLYVNAWRPLPEPYQPETAAQRPEWKDRMLHTFLGGHHD